VDGTVPESTLPLFYKVLYNGIRTRGLHFDKLSTELEYCDYLLVFNYQQIQYSCMNKGTGLNTAITSILSSTNKHSIRACTRKFKGKIKGE
jgi:hypothetical protein